MVKQKLWMVAVVMVACLAWNSTGDTAHAQAKAEPKAQAKKEPAKPRGRLPSFYGDVVSPDQREKIYAIQQSYVEKIAALQAQLKELQAKMDSEVQGVLTAEQLKKVEELSGVSKAKAKAAKTGDAPESAGEAAPAKSAASAAAKK